MHMFNNKPSLKKYTECSQVSAEDSVFQKLGIHVWGQPIKLVQVASTSQLRENQRNNFLLFEIVPSHFSGASEVQT